MSAVQEFFKSSGMWLQSILLIIIGIFALKEIIVAITYFVEKLGVKTKRVIEKEKLLERVKALEENDISQKDKIEKMTNVLDRIDRRLLNMEISGMRKEILDMASGLPTTRKFTKEHFTKIFACYQEYEKILEENNMENGQVEVSMQLIREEYKKRLANGEFTG